MQARIADLCDVVIGRTPRRERLEYWGGTTPWVSIRDLNGGTINTTRECISDLAVREVMPRPVPAGTLLFSFKLTIGKTGLAARPLYTNEAIAALPIKRPDLITVSYLKYALEAVSAADDANHAVLGKVLNKEKVGDLRIKLPPLDEQQRIVDILDRAASIQRLRQAADDKLKQIIPALFVDMFGDPATNPKGWPTNSLAKLVRATSGGTPSKARSDFWEGDVPWVSPKDMKKLEIYDAQDHISEKVFAETALKRIPANSVLIVVRGMILVHTVPVAIAKVDCAINQDMKALEPNSMLLPEFLFWTLRSLHETLLQSVSTAAHGTKKIDMAVIDNLTIPVPPLELQSDFKKMAEKLLRMQDRSRSLTDTALSTAASLSSAVFGLKAS